MANNLRLKYWCQKCWIMFFCMATAKDFNRFSLAVMSSQTGNKSKMKNYWLFN